MLNGLRCEQRKLNFSRILARQCDGAMGSPPLPARVVAESGQRGGNRNPMIRGYRISLVALALSTLAQALACSDPSVSDDVPANAGRSAQSTAGTGGVPGVAGSAGAAAWGIAGTPSAAGAFGQGGLDSSAGAGAGGSSGTGGAGGPTAGSAGIPSTSGAGSSAAHAGSSGRGGSAGAAGGSPLFAKVSTIFGKNCGIVGCHADEETPHFAADALLYATLTANTVLAECGYTKLIEPGDPSKSALVRLINRQCDGFIMPPTCKTNPCLPAADLATLTDWIQAGALP